MTVSRTQFTQNDFLSKSETLNTPYKVDKIQNANILKAIPRDTDMWRNKQKRIDQAITDTNPRVIVFGDSIMSNLTRSSVTRSKSWEKANILLAGISGDRIENVMFRLEETKFPEDLTHIYIAVGTNNLFKLSLRSKIKRGLCESRKAI